MIPKVYTTEPLIPIVDRLKRMLIPLAAEEKEQPMRIAAHGTRIYIDSMADCYSYVMAKKNIDLGVYAEEFARFAWRNRLMDELNPRDGFLTRDHLSKLHVMFQHIELNRCPNCKHHLG